MPGIGGRTGNDPVATIADLNVTSSAPSTAIVFAPVNCPAPCQPIVYLEESNRPQPRLDVERDGGMTVSIGRLRACPVLGHKFVALGHNTIRGAAGAAILNAELMQAEGLL